MHAPERDSLIDGRYRIVRAIGLGGFAETYLAQDLRENGRNVVIKLPNLAQLGEPAYYERFRRELMVGKKLKHRDLCVAINYSEGNPPYLVFEFIQNQTLAALLDKECLFSAEESVKLVADLLDALNYCHEKGVIHRDIKPENLMIGDDGHLKIIDFGISVTDSSPRVTWRGFSGLVGTPEYMSPEQIKGERGGVQSDIYAVGCLLYHMIAGFPPFTGDNPMTIMFQHMTSSPKGLTNIRRGMDNRIWAVVCRAMRRRKEERYVTAADMAYDLRNLEQADLKYIDMENPPLNSLAQNGKFSMIFRIIIAAALIAIALGIPLYFLLGH